MKEGDKRKEKWGESEEEKRESVCVLCVSECSIESLLWFVLECERIQYKFFESIYQTKGERERWRDRGR